MYLKRMEVAGFKSFADHIKLDFEPGLTAVVGPNGCGKSNIIDAIRWCLGEMSAKSLRSNLMMDVVFNGSGSRPAQNLAEVTLTFDNTDKRLPIDYTDVSITRKLFRSGESEYFINKTQCRLRDIKELFLDTGMGGRADDATGLVYFWNRWYEAGSGLWMSEDPIRQSGGSNLLLYVSGNPVTHVDFRGLAEILIDIYQMQGFAPEAFYKGTRLPVPTDQLRIFKFDKDSGYRYKNSTDDTYLFHRDGYDDAKGRFAPHIESSNPDPLPEGYFRRLWEQTRRALEIGPVPCDPKNIVNGGPIRG